MQVWHRPAFLADSPQRSREGAGSIGSHLASKRFKVTLTFPVCRGTPHAPSEDKGGIVLASVSQSIPLDHLPVPSITLTVA